MSKSFEKAVKDWITKAEADSLEIAKDSARAFVSEYQAAAPKVTGNLANSITVASSPQSLIIGAPGQAYADPSASNNAVINSMEMGSSVYVAAVAPYAAKEEFGRIAPDGTATPGKFFGTQTAAKWRGIVQRVAKSRGRSVR